MRYTGLLHGLTLAHNKQNPVYMFDDTACMLTACRHAILSHDLIP